MGKRIINVYRWRAAAVLALAAPLLSGCGESTARALGWEKTTPDEFQVVTRAPLTQPPDYDLRPPASGSARPTETNTVEQAKKVLIGPGGTSGTPRPAAKSDNPALAGLTPGERALLHQAGAENATPDVRRQVDQETTALVKEGDSFTNELLFWRETPQPGEIVDPDAESKRLQTNASLGKPATDGDSPQIVRKPKAWLEDIF